MLEQAYHQRFVLYARVGSPNYIAVADYFIVCTLESADNIRQDHTKQRRLVFSEYNGQSCGQGGFNRLFDTQGQNLHHLPHKELTCDFCVFCKLSDVDGGFKLHI